MAEAVLALPSSMISIALVSPAASIAVPSLQGCVGLRSVSLGADITCDKDLRQLPALPQTVTHLALSHHHITGFQQLTRLTDLRELHMPQPPTEQQLLIIKQLRQLRNLEIIALGIPCLPCRLCLVGYVHLTLLLI